MAARHGAVHVDVLGTKAVGDPVPLARDAIFRIASLTKPVTAVAAMILVDEAVADARPPWPPTPYTPDEWLRRFGSLPLITSR